MGKQAETLGKYTSKGDKLLFEGRLETRNYEDKDGNKKYSSDINVDKFLFLANKKSAE